MKVTKTFVQPPAGTVRLVNAPPNPSGTTLKPSGRLKLLMVRSELPLFAITNPRAGSSPISILPKSRLVLTEIIRVSDCAEAFDGKITAPASITAASPKHSPGQQFLTEGLFIGVTFFARHQSKLASICQSVGFAFNFANWTWRRRKQAKRYFYWPTMVWNENPLG